MAAPGDISSDNVKKKISFFGNKFTFLCACLASTTSILLGYDIGVMSGAVLFMREDLHISSTHLEILIGSLNVCSLFGSLASGKTSDKIGRRYTIVLAAITFLVGAVLMGLAPSYGMLLAGRIVAGIGVGYSLMIAPVYAAEVSPASVRGFLTSLPEVFINVGILLGYVFNYAFAGLPMHYNWRIMLGVAAVPAIAIGTGVMFMPESPRWLVMRGKMEEARRVLTRTSEDEGEAIKRLDEIQESIQSTATGPNQTNRGAWKELFVRPTPAVKKMMLAAIGINFFMQASGNDAVVYYCPEVFKAAGIQNKKQLVLVTVIMGIVKTLFVLASALYLDKFGRRRMLFVGSTGIAVSLGLLGLGSKVVESSPRTQWAVILSVIAVCSDVASFSIGLGPIAWVYTSEIFPTRLRAQGASIAISVNRVVSGAVSMSFLSLSSAISFGGTFFLFAGISAAGLVFFYFCLPETKGKSLEELAHIFEKDPSPADLEAGPTP